MATRSARPASRHPVNRELFDEAPLGARIADRVTGFMGSWRFLILQTVLVAIWLGGNIYLLTKPFDPYPFILLNLAFSTQAAYAARLPMTSEAAVDAAIAAGVAQEVDTGGYFLCSIVNAHAAP